MGHEKFSDIFSFRQIHTWADAELWNSFCENILELLQNLIDLQIHVRYSTVWVIPKAPCAIDKSSSIVLMTLWYWIFDEALNPIYRILKSGEFKDWLLIWIKCPPFEAISTHVEGIWILALSSCTISGVPLTNKNPAWNVQIAFVVI